MQSILFLYTDVNVWKFHDKTEYCFSNILKITDTELISI